MQEWLPIAIYVVAAIVLAAFAFVLLITQIKLNKALTLSVEAVSGANTYQQEKGLEAEENTEIAIITESNEGVERTDSIEGAEISEGKEGAETSEKKMSDRTAEYYAAITYLEAARQLYSENNSINVASLIYVLMSTIILAHGAKLLRISDKDKEEVINKVLSQTENAYDEKIEQQKEGIQKYADDLLTIETTKMREMTNKQIEYMQACFSCVSSIQIIYLLRAKLAKGIRVRLRDDEIAMFQRLHISLTNNLESFTTYFEANVNEEDKNMKALLNMNAYHLIKAVEEYLMIKKPNCIDEDGFERKYIERLEVNL